MLMLSLFSELDFASLYEEKIVRLSSQMKRLSTYKIFLCICRPGHGPEIPEIPEILKSVLKCPEIH